MRTMSLVNSKSSIGPLAAVLLVVVVVNGAQAESVLQETAAGVAKARASIKPTQLEVAETFARLVGEKRLYKHVLNINLKPELARVQKYIDEVRRQGMRQTPELDAAAITLQQFTGKSDEQLMEEAGTLIESHLVPACREYVAALGPVFEGAEAPNKRARLEQEVRDQGTDNRSAEVRELVLTWAHFGTCRALVDANRSLMIKRFPGRLEDSRKVEARLQQRREAGF